MCFFGFQGYREFYIHRPQFSNCVLVKFCNGWCMDPIGVQRTQKTVVKSSTLYLDYGRQANGLETGNQDRRGKVLGQGRKARSNYQEADEAGNGQAMSVLGRQARERWEDLHGKEQSGKGVSVELVTICWADCM